jgi:hypothetical protein
VTLTPLFKLARTLKVHLHESFGFNWFGQTNQSRLLINVLKYFWFWFWIRRDIRHFVHSAYSQYSYKFIPRILSIWTNSFHSAYSQNTNRFIPRILSIRTAKFCSKISFISWILRICTDSFRCFSVYKQIHSVYSQYMYRFVVHIRRMRPNNFEHSELKNFLYSF